MGMKDDFYKTRTCNHHPETCTCRDEIFAKPKYKIYGKERRAVKGKLADLKSCLKNFWHSHTMDKDMCFFYGGEERLMSDIEAQKRYEEIEAEIKEIEASLKEEY